MKMLKKCELIALDGTGFTNDYADKYYAKIRKKERKSYVKNHITIECLFKVYFTLFGSTWT